MRRGRRVWRWLADWHNGATLAASGLVALLAFTVYDSTQRRQAAEAERERLLDERGSLVAQVEENAKLIIDLQAQVVQLCGDRPGCAPVERPAPTEGPASRPSTTSTTGRRATTTTRRPGPTSTSTTPTSRPPGTTSTTQRPNQPVCTTLPITERCL